MNEVLTIMSSHGGRLVDHRNLKAAFRKRDNVPQGPRKTCIQAIPMMTCNSSLVFLDTDLSRDTETSPASPCRDMRRAMFCRVQARQESTSFEVR